MPRIFCALSVSSLLLPCTDFGDLCGVSVGLGDSVGLGYTPRWCGTFGTPVPPCLLGQVREKARTNGRDGS